MRRLALAAAFLAAATPAFAQNAPARLPPTPIAPQATSFKLANGLEVVVVPDRRAPVVTHMIWYRAGSADEPAGKSGIAHFLEHLMFKGTERFPAGSFSRRLSELGGQENAFTSWDFTGYFQRAPKEHLPFLMDFESDRMMNLRLTDDVVNPERDVILEERKQVVDNNPSSQLAEQIGAALFQNHPYRIPIIGWEHEMRGLTREDAFAFYERFYTPNNAVVVIAGDVTEPEVRALAERTYGRVPVRVPNIVRNRPSEPPARAKRMVAMTDARVQQPSWSRSYVTPTDRKAEGNEGAALDVLGDILGGETGRIFRSLVVEKGLAASAGAGFSGQALDYGRFTLFATPRPGVTFEQIEAAMDAVIAEIVEKGVTQAEVDRAVNSSLASAIYAQDSPQGLARVIGGAMMVGYTLDEVKELPKRTVSVTPAQVQAAARAYLDVRRSVTSTLARDAAANRS